MAKDGRDSKMMTGIVSDSRATGELACQIFEKMPGISKAQK